MVLAASNAIVLVATAEMVRRDAVFRQEHFEDQKSRGCVREV